MEVLKTISNLEFELIYADGTRRRVKEGILYEAEDSGDMIFHNGTDQPAVLLAAAECALVSLNQIGPGLEALVVRMALTEEPRAALERLVKFGSKLLKVDSAEKQACFRLGQMDMRESVAAKLQDAAGNVRGIARATLENAVAMVNEMEALK